MMNGQPPEEKEQPRPDGADEPSVPIPPPRMGPRRILATVNPKGVRS